MKVTKLKSTDITFLRIELNKGNSFTTYKMDDEPRAFALRVGGKVVSNPIPRKYRNKVRNEYYTAKHHITRQLSRLDRRTQYYINSGTDCDGVSSSRAVKFESAFGALESIDASYEWADGPEYWTKCTKEEYENYEATYRDYGMEAHEDGHPHVRYG